MYFMKHLFKYYIPSTSHVSSLDSGLLKGLD